MKFEFNRSRIDKIPRDKIIEELEKAARKFNYTEFGWRDFVKVADISATVVKKEFGSWRKALLVLKETLNQKSLNLLPRQAPPNRIHSDRVMFEQIEQIWSKLGHRPSRTEWELSRPKIHYSTYKQRFGGWQKACLRFIEYKMGDNVTADNEQAKVEVEKTWTRTKPVAAFQREETRSIPLNIRLKVLDRDQFRCVFCGRSPATDVGVKLHIDHKIPFSKGGKTTTDNLQTLCYECNIGKGDSALVNR